MKKIIIAVILAIIVIVALGVEIGLDSGSKSLVVYSADAYVAESNTLISGFHNATGVPVDRAIGGGSYTVAREISQGVPASVFISVALDSYQKSYLGSRYSGWAVAFASDQLVLAYYSNNSAVWNIVQAFREAGPSNNTTQYAHAFDLLTSGQVKIGISNASSDPAGVRGYLSLEIAGSLYHNGSESYYIDQLQSSGSIVNRSNAAELVSPLESGDISFLYIYKSAAISKGLKYITLPDAINFGNASLSSSYSSYQYPTAEGEVKGMPIYLFVSAISNGTNPTASMEFVNYVIGNGSLVSGYGLKPLSHPLLFNSTAVPSAISVFVHNGKLVYSGPI